ncbi:hypothetical protein SANTM175S_10668 [Streptomyces antimycoticus]
MDWEIREGTVDRLQKAYAAVEQGDDVFMDSWRMVDGGPDAAAAVGRLVAATTELARATRGSTPVRT